VIAEVRLRNLVPAWSMLPSLVRARLARLAVSLETAEASRLKLNSRLFVAAQSIHQAPRPQ
jgi:hypothetical protein